MSAALMRDVLAPLRADPGRAAVLLDIDGTLAPIAERAADAHVPEPTRQLVIETATRYKLVSCVSGRRASEARAMVSVGTITYLGSHGAEILRPGWVNPALDPRVEAWVPKIEEFEGGLELGAVRQKRIRVEDKGAILAFHWRGAPDESAAREEAEGIAARAEDAGLHPVWGRKVLEVRPPITIDKGTGVTTLISEADVDRAVYAGDDRTDLDAFRALTQMAEAGTIAHAVRVGVSSDEGPAEIGDETDLLVEGTDGVRRLLEMLVAD